MYRKQRVQVNNSYSIWQEVLFLVLQGSFSNQFLTDLRFILNDIDTANDSDSTQPYIISNNTDELIAFLEKFSEDFFKWFNNNLIKNNLEMFHLVLISHEKMKIESESTE